MTIWSGMGVGARAAVVAAGAGVVAAAGWFTLSGHPEVPVSQAQPEAKVTEQAVAAPVTVAPAVVEPPAAEVAANPPPAEPVAVEVAPAAPAAPTAPQFDVVRVEPDGSATIAGYAAPGSTVSLRVDGAEVVTAPTDASGNFAVLFTLPPSKVPRLLSLAMIATDGETVVGPDTVALAPTAAAIVAAPAADPAPVDVAKAPAVVDPAVEPAPPAALLVTESGVEVLQSGTEPAPGLTANVSVDTISYSPAGEVQLGGRGQRAAFVRLYLDGTEISTVVVGAGGQWATVLADVAPGIYTLRADQIGADGKVTSRFETPFKRETLQALAAAAAPAVAAAVEPEPTAQVAQGDPVVVEPVAPVVAKPVAKPAVAAQVQDPMGVTPAPAEVLIGDPPATEIAPAQTATADPAPASEDPAPAAIVAEAAPAEPAPAAIVAEPAPVDPAPADVVAEAAPVVPEATSEPAAKPALVSITVQPGYTLWGIAKQQMGDGVMYVQVFEANKDKIRDPDLIYPGQVFTMPAAN